MSPDQAKLEKFLGSIVTDMGAAATAAMVLLGDQLGLYKALADAGPSTSEELAKSTGTRERYVREWLANQAASGYLEYDRENKKFYLNEEQSMVFANEDSPVFLTGGFESLASLYFDKDKIKQAFQTGEGISWGDHHPCLFDGTAKFFRTSYRSHLVQDWIPALKGTQEILERGGKAADVGCGHGLSTLIMAQAFPKSHFYGFDFHPDSITAARRHAKDQGIKNVTFEEASAKDFPGQDYDLVTFFDCLHDMGDPVGISKHVCQSLNPEGTWMVVEPYAEDELTGNFNPVGRLYYAFSTGVCTPSSLSQEVGLGLGAQAGEKRLKEVVTSGGFTRFRRATQTPFNLILEAKP